MTNPFRAFLGAVILTSAFILGFTASVNANVYSWSGGGSSGFWSDAGNWGFAGVPGNGDSVVFPAPSSLISTTNNIVGLSLVQIRFAGNGGGTTLTGNAITLTGGIEATNTIGLNTISNNITLGADIQVDVGNNAFLNLGGLLLQGSSFGVTKIGAGTLTYDGQASDTYTGTTHVNAGLLQLNVGGANAFAGPLVIGDGSGTGSPIVRLLQFSELPDTQPITVNLNGLLDLNGFPDTTGPLTIQGGIVETEGGTLSLNADVTILGSGAEAMITGNLHFLGGLHLVNVADGAAFRDLDLLANVSDAGGGLLFTNSVPSAANARLVGNNTFTGPLTIDNLTVSAETPTALGSTAAGTSVGSHGTLYLFSTGITNETLTMAGGATLFAQDNCVWNGPIVLNGNVTIDDYPNVSTLTLNGVISGSGGFTKVDVGTLQLFGPSGNSYAGNTYIEDGTCLIDKASGAAIPAGTLTIGDHSGTNATVRDINVGGNLGSSVALAINEGGLLDLNGEGETVGPIAFSGGAISTGSGHLAINGDVDVLASTNTATINGAIVFGNGVRTITLDTSEIYPNLTVTASVADNGAGIKVVLGDLSLFYDDLSLQGSNTFTGPLTIDSTFVDVDTPWALGATSGGTFVTNSGTLWLYQTAITNETVTLAAGTEFAGQNNCIWNGPVNLVGNAKIFNPSPFTYCFDIQGPITGTGDLYVQGSAGTGATNRFSGPLPNTFAGNTTVNFTTLLLAKASIGGGIPSNLVVNGSSVVRVANNYQINSPFKSVSIGEAGLLDLGGFSEWVGPLTLQGAQVTTTAGGLLYLGGDITVTNSTVAMSQISGNATLWNGTRTINCIGHYYSPDFAMVANLAGNLTSGLVKTGDGEASLAGNNTFPGPTTVNAGSLELHANNALGNISTPATVTNTGNIFLNGNVVVGNKPLILSGTGNGLGVLSAGFGTGTWAGNITLLSNVGIDVYTNSTLELGGVITGPGGLTKMDWGNLLLDGNLANNFSGPTLVQSGILTLSKTNGPALIGPLTIGQGLDAANQDVVDTVLNYQLPTNNPTTISSSGLLDVSGATSFNNNVGSLTGTGAVHIGNNNLTDGYDNTSTTYAGAISGNVSGGALVKMGGGAWTLTGASTFAGIMQVQAGSVYVNGSMPSTSASFINGSLLGGNGTVGPIGFNRGILAPGTNSGPGILNVNSGGVNLNSNDTFTVSIAGTTAGSGYSQLNVTGSVGLNNAALQLNMPVVGVSNAVYTIINNDAADAVTGVFTNLLEGYTNTAANGAKFKITYHGGSGNDVVLTQISLPTQPNFTSITNLGAGGIKLGGIGMSNVTYTVSANTNLLTTNWVNIGTATANGLGVFQFTDPGAINYLVRFYRFSWP
ncbi:MAG TPA: autotransporter-associated beta strand repeat-containing protein [Candidatus Acidoferrales bacterium]|jgi:fibronectin-binding autotransporter adhesin|nr:autotransporter-associated beta strand repeat-containing protein [Candidatus Acidoferrales bacterium]